MKLLRIALIVCAISLLAVACQPAVVQPSPTSLPSVSPTENEPASLPTMVIPTKAPPEESITPAVEQPSASPTPSPSAVPVVNTNLAGRILNYKGGFSFRTPILTSVEMNEGQASLWEQFNLVQIVLQGKTFDNPAGIPPEDLLPGVLEKFAKNLSDFQAGEPYPVEVNGLPGLAVDYTAENRNDPLIGRIYSVAVTPNQSFLAIAFVPRIEDKNIWEEHVADTMEGVIRSVQFFDPAAAPQTCSISTDETYGLTQENPIKIGTGITTESNPDEIPADPITTEGRIQLFFDTLRGSGGQKIRFDYLDSVEVNGKTLDKFEVSYTGQIPLVLYLDLSEFSEPLAPVGFSCSGPFPLGAP